MKPNPTIAPFNIQPPLEDRQKPQACSRKVTVRKDRRALCTPLFQGYTDRMVSRGFTVFLALLRIASGVVLVLAGLGKLGWFTSPAALQAMFQKFAANAANPLVAKYVAFVTPHAGLFSKMVVL